MNRFKNLDSYFPTGKDRLFGEVVRVTIICMFHGEVVTTYSWKRKSAHVNASVNAFHMHRGLCHEFSSENKWLPRGRERDIKRVFGDLVNDAYLGCHVQGVQNHDYVVDLVTRHWACVPKDSDGNFAEILRKNAEYLGIEWELVPYCFDSFETEPT